MYHWFHAGARLSRSAQLHTHRLANMRSEVVAAALADLRRPAQAWINNINVDKTLAGVTFPAYMSFRALETMDPGDEKQWLTYWIIFSILQSIEVLLYYIVTWIPLYYELKLLFLVWMINPATRGAEVLYNKYLWKFLKAYASQFDPTFKSSNSVPPELHRQLFLKAKEKAEISPDFFKSMLGDGKDLTGAALSFFGKMAS